jgi:hypothetical protein
MTDGSRIQRLLGSRRTLVMLLLAGLLIRLIWLAFSRSNWLSIGESLNVARAIAETGIIADAFKPGQGPTAHVMPISPLIAGGIYRIFGFQTLPAEALLTLWSIGLVLTSFLFFDKVFEKLGSPLLARRAALVFLCLVPLNFSLEATWFRVWEGGLAVAIAAGFLWLVVNWDGQPVTWGRIVAASLILAVLAFVQPNFGLAAGVCALMFAIRNIPLARWPGTIAIAGLMAVLVFGPWAARNAAVMHSPILLRSNAGLEMALAFHPEAATTSDPRQTFFVRHQLIHPYENGPGFAAMLAAGGEVAYARGLGKETMAWMAANPVATVRLGARHLVEVIFPPEWYWTMFSRQGTGNLGKMLLHWLVSAFGIIGIVQAVMAADRRWRYPVIMATVSILPFVLVQPTLRYRYLIFALLVFFAAHAVVTLVQRLRATGSVRPVAAR